MQDNDHDYYGMDSDSENVNVDSLKNVLLVTGPVGVCTDFKYILAKL